MVESVVGRRCELLVKGGEWWSMGVRLSFLEQKKEGVEGRWLLRWFGVGCGGG